MSDITLLPDKIKSGWQPWLDQPAVTPMQRLCVRRVIRYTLPPSCRVSLLSAAETYDMDHVEDKTMPIVQAFIKQVGLETASSRLSKQAYPLFTALTDPNHLGGQSSLRTLCRQQISAWFSNVATDAQATLYYSHLIKCRSILEIVCESQNAEAAGITQRLGFLISLAGSSELASRIAQKADYYQLFLDICEVHREAGVRIRNVTNRESGSRRQPHDIWHDQILCQLKKATPTASYKRVTLDDHVSDDDYPIEAQQCGMRAINNARDATVDDETAIAFQRQQFSTFTPSDDQLLVRHIVRASATSTIAHDCDLHRLPPERILSVLESDMSAVQRTIVLLLVATGLPVSRLSSLRSAEACFMQLGSTLPDDDAPRLEPVSRTLAYRLTDGPLDAATNANRWVVLRLPRHMGDSLTTVLDGDTPADKVFTTILQRLTSYLRRYSRARPGVNITPNRLAASSWAWRRPMSRDDVSAQWLRGTLGLGLSAPAAYRRVDRLELQQTFDQVLRALGVPLDHETPSLSPLIAGISKTAGSPHAVPQDAFKPVLDTLRREVGDAHLERRHPLCRGLQGRDALVALAQRLAAHTYFSWLLATGTRPVGPAAQNRLSGTRMWIRDKASGQGNESRVIPIVSSISDALKRHQRWTTHAIAEWQRLGGMVEDQRSTRRDTPAWFSPGRGKTTLVVRDIQHRDLPPLLASLPSLPASVSHWPDNVTRHSLATWLRYRCPDADIDALLGHAHSGVSITSLSASARIGSQSALRRALRDWLNACGYNALAWEAL
tara:strand:+ start:2122 stop:4458 length:2337 start_codon:yes stop_codon:yes gene_type:complete